MRYMVLLLALCGAVQAEERYNPMSSKGTALDSQHGQWETVGQADESLRYNPMENEWSYERDEADLEYQPMQDDWQYSEDTK